VEKVFTYVIGTAMGAVIAFAIVVVMVFAALAIFGTSPTAPNVAGNAQQQANPRYTAIPGQGTPTPAPASTACPGWLTSPDYWRGLASSDWHFTDLVSPCWLRGRADASGAGSSASTCPAGSHSVGNGKCCPDGKHQSELEPDQCTQDGFHVVGGGYSCRDGFHRDGDSCAPDAAAPAPHITILKPAPRCSDREHWDGAKCTVF
jgi:hypothetical protein